MSDDLLSRAEATLLADKCASRATVRRWRSKPKNRIKEAEASHSRYEKKVKKKPGRNTKVKRRPRLK